MNKVTVSAPGKLMLFGEHAVVNGYPCIVTAVDQRLKVTIENISDPIFSLNAPDVKVSSYSKKLNEVGNGDIPKEAAFVEKAVLLFYKKYKIASGIEVTTSSEFKSTFGFGSSSASTVAVLFGLSKLFGKKLSNKQLFDLSYKVVLDVQKKGSGFDVAAAIYGGTIYFVGGGKKIRPLRLKALPLLVGYSGIKADTVTLINKVLEKFASNRTRQDEIYRSISQIVEVANKALTDQDWEELGRLMMHNQRLLVELGVSVDRLDAMINKALDAGAYGAKLSGAGGGDCMIALCSLKDREKVERAIERVGGEILKVNGNAQGVRIEKK